MTEVRKIYFKNAAGEVHPVNLPAIEAVNAVGKHPHEWSYDPEKFAEPPAGFLPSEGAGGGIGRVRGASVRVD
jgi:hypothetical protein